MSKKISELTAAGALTGTELVEVVQSSASRRTTAQDIADLAGSGISGLTTGRLPKAASSTSIDDSVVHQNSTSIGIGTTSPDRKFHVEEDSATTNAVTYVERLTSTSSGTPANGIGVGLEFETETSAGNNEVGATIEVVATDVTAASEDFDIRFRAMAAGSAATEKFRIASFGGIGLGGANYGTSGQVITSNGSASAPTWQTISGLISGLTTNRIPYATSATTLGDDSALTWDPTNNALTINVLRMHSTGTLNTFLGQNNGNFTVSGSGNVGVGAGVLANISTGSDNIGIGSANILASMASGTRNIAIGTSTLVNGTGDNNIVIGYSNAANLTSGDNNIAIGVSGNLPSATDDNQLNIQNIIYGVNNSGSGNTVSTGSIGIGITAPSAKLDIDGAVKVKSYTVAGVPSASTNGAGSMIYVSNEAGGAVIAFSDGTDWRRVTDRAIIS